MLTITNLSINSKQLHGKIMLCVFISCFRLCQISVNCYDVFVCSYTCKVIYLVRVARKIINNSYKLVLISDWFCKSL